MNKLTFILLAIVTLTGCQKYFDVNADPASPQNADLASILPPILANAHFQHAVDGRNAAILSQNFTGNTGAGQHDIHGGNAGGTAGTGFWRIFYVNMGTSLNLITQKGIEDENWDYVGVAYAMRAWGFQQLTSYFSDAPFAQAWKANQASFEYDTQEEILEGVDSLLRTALFYLNRTDGKVSASQLGRGDIIYKGDRNKWIRFVHGLLARNFHRYTNKGIYISEGYADSVIKYVDLSFSGIADNYQVPYPATKNDDTNPFGPARNNFSLDKQSRFITQLLDGTILAGTPAVATNRDPRLRAMLSISADTATITNSMPIPNGGYRFNLLQPTNGGDFESGVTGGTTPGTPAYRRRVGIPYSDSVPTNTGVAVFSKAGKYVFQNSAPGTLMSYHELQFLKAEAAHRKGNKALAHTAYLNGINAHFDFVNFYSNLSGNTAAITNTQKAQYLASPAVKSTPATLTLTDIMLQKYIGDWAWNPYETWTDVRRYHYFDADPETGEQVYRTLVIPFYSTNNLGPKPAYRFLPTNFSEFDWNEQEIRKIGGFNQDYHTYEMWFSQP